MLVAELLDRKLFNNSVLDFFKPEVSFVELSADFRDNDFVLCRGVPRKVEHGVKISADHRSLLRAVGHFHQLTALLKQGFLTFFIKLKLQNPVGIVLRFIGRIVIFSELLLDNLLLLSEEKVALGFVNPHLGFNSDFFLDFENINLVHQLVKHGFEPVVLIESFEYHLLNGVVKRNVRRDIIGKLAC